MKELCVESDSLVCEKQNLCHPSLSQTHGFKASTCLSSLNSGDDRYLLLSPAEDTSVSVMKYTGAYTVILLDPICLLTFLERSF